MDAPELIRSTSYGVTLLGDPNRPGGVTLAFTEREGGASSGCYESLNLDDAVGDDGKLVRENRLRALAAVGARSFSESLICPLQVHGDNVVVVGGNGMTPCEAKRAAREGADAIVCLEPRVPVLLCFADCVPVVLAADGGFAVIHSGWKGTMARIAGKALRVLTSELGCKASDVNAYIGPRIGVRDYEVSEELAARFATEFGKDVVADGRNLDLGKAICDTLVAEGMDRKAIAYVEESTASNVERFFSYRAQGGSCGRHGALAWMASAER